MKQIVLLSDAHQTLDERFFPHFEGADEIWHAGDIGDLSVTDKLKDFAPIRGVCGNIDNKTIRTEFKGNLYFKCEEVNVMMTHIGGYPGRYNKKILAFNDNKLYSEHFAKRGVAYVDQYTTPILDHATPIEISRMNIINHSWTYGDRYYKLAHQHYNDSELWWVIAWFNKKPTESHVKLGEIIYIPTPLSDVLKVYGLYY